MHFSYSRGTAGHIKTGNCQSDLLTPKHMQLVRIFSSHTPCLQGPLRIDASRRRAALALKVKALKKDPKQQLELFNPSFETVLERRSWRQNFNKNRKKNISHLKRDFDQCKGYRDYMLLSAPGKILNRIVLDRIKPTFQNLQDEQARFRREICKHQELFDKKAFCPSKFQTLKKH